MKGFYKSLYIILFILASSMLFADSVWEGNTAMGRYGEFPSTGYYGASNSFSRNSIVEVTNPANGTSVEIIIVDRLDDPGLFLLLSREAAEAIGLDENSVINTKVSSAANNNQQLSVFEEDLAYNPDPDINPAASAADPNKRVLDETMYEDLEVVEHVRTEDVNDTAADDIEVADDTEITSDDGEDSVSTEDTLPENETVETGQQISDTADIDAPEDDTETDEPDTPKITDLATPEGEESDFNGSVVDMPEVAAEESGPVDESAPDTPQYSDVPEYFPEESERDVMAMDIPSELKEDAADVTTAGEPEIVYVEVPVEPADEEEAWGPRISDMPYIINGEGAVETTLTPPLFPDRPYSLDEYLAYAHPNDPKLNVVAIDTPNAAEPDSTGIGKDSPRIQELEVIPEPMNVDIAVAEPPVPEALNQGPYYVNLLEPELPTVAIADISPEHEPLETTTEVEPERIALPVEETGPRVINGINPEEPTDDTRIAAADIPSVEEPSGSEIEIFLQPAEERPPELTEEELAELLGTAAEPEILVNGDLIEDEASTEDIAEAHPEIDDETGITGSEIVVDEPELIDETEGVEVADETTSGDSETGMNITEMNQVDVSSRIPLDSADIPLVKMLEENDYYLQLGVFSDGNNAYSLASRLLDSYPVIIYDNGADRYKVMIGPLTYDEVGVALYQVKAIGYTDAFLLQGSK